MNFHIIFIKEELDEELELFDELELVDELELELELNELKFDSRWR
jgi:hypothetical protein